VSFFINQLTLFVFSVNESCRRTVKNETRNVKLLITTQVVKTVVPERRDVGFNIPVTRILWN